MSTEVTRAYMRGRLIAVLVGFVIAVSAGTSILLWQAQKAKNYVRFGALVSYMAESTSDVIHNALRLEHTSMHRARTAAPPGDGPHKAGIEAIRADLSAAVGNLEAAYRALELAARGDVMMLESERITREQGDGEIGPGAQTGQTIMADVAGRPVPPSVLAVWEGRDGRAALDAEIKEILTLASRLDIFSDYSNPTARRVFSEIQRLANQEVQPHLSEVLVTLNRESIATYGTLQWILVMVACSIVGASLAVGLRVFMPMMHRVATAHEELQEANRSIEAARVKAESADRAKSEFLANMSHEIRTPMNGVMGMAELLSRSDLDQRQSMFVDVIVKSGNALLTIINDILDFSKIDAGQMALDPAPFKLGEAIEDVATLVSARVAEKDLELIVRVDPELPQSFIGDVGRFRQVATNLVGNAVKFTEKGHVLVDVSGRLKGSLTEVTVRVEDTGIGIPADKLGGVFDKFAQVDSSSTRRYEGTGLGLAIASRLVELMGGTVGAESKVGKGSAFWFTLPLTADQSAARPQPVPVDVSGARVLAIDDNEINRRILLEQLRSWGFDCAAAESGELGLAFLERAAELGTTVDCVILDYQMPGMNGADVARRIKSDPATAGVPIVLLTSVDQTDSGRLAIECGISAQLHKPARSSALLETIVSVMQIARDSVDRPGVHPLPLRPRPQPAGQTRHAGATAKAAGQLDVLVAEDNEVNQLVFSQVLDQLGVSYRIANNGKTAVEMHRALKPKLILMDVSMPEMSGFDATAAIRRAEEATEHRTPIIGITAHALKGDREKCVGAGMDDYLSKPISPAKLSNKIELWMHREAESREAAIA